jgi:hypothetical protein
MKNLVALFAFILLGAGAFAQQATDPNVNPDLSPRFRMGLGVSPVLSWFNTSGDAGLVEPDGVRFNILFGLHTDFRIGYNSNYYFSTGLFLMNTGGTLRHEYFVENEDGTYSLTEREVQHRLNYVNIPLTIMLRTNQIGYNHYFVRLGFDSGFNIASTYDSDDTRVAGSQQTVTIEDADGSDFAALFRFGLHIELGMEYNIGGNTNLFFGVEYNNGLNSIFSDDYRLPTGQTRPETNELSIDPETGLPFVDQRVKASSNFIALKLGAYF